MDNKKKYTLRKKLVYELDDFISKGFWAQLALLLGCVLVLAFICAVVVMIFAEGKDFGESLWQSLMHIIDQGTITGDDTDNTNYLFIMLGITFVGMAFTSVIIGITSSAITHKMDEFNKGRSRIIEKNHTVVLGFNENTHTIRSEIEAGNEKKKGNHCVVIVGDLPKDEMEHITQEISWSSRGEEDEEDVKTSRKSGKTTVLFRSGDPASENTFLMCAADRAASVIINGDDDFETIRILLALTAYLKKAKAYVGNEKMPSVVALIRRSENLSAAKIAADVFRTEAGTAPKRRNEYKVRILYFRDIFAKIFAQVCVQPGLSMVMGDLLNSSNASFYIEDKQKEADTQLQEALVGKNLSEIIRSLHGVTPVGFASVDENGQNHVIINPEDSVRYAPDDMLIYLADSEDELGITEDTEMKPAGEPAAEGAEKEKTARRFLIMGSSAALPRLLKNMNEYCDDGSGINIVSPHGVDYDGDGLDAFDSRHVIEDDPYNWDHMVKHLKAHSYWFDKNDERHLTNMIILSTDGIDRAEADKKVMVLLLNMREYLKDNCDFGISITTEIKLPQNQDLVQTVNVNDFIVGSQSADRFMVQVAEDPKKYYIFEELLKKQGNVVTLKPFSDYVDTSKPFNFAGISELVMKESRKTGKQEIALGWVELYGEDAGEGDASTRQMVLNPNAVQRNGIFTDGTGSSFSAFRLILLSSRTE